MTLSLTARTLLAFVTACLLLAVYGPIIVTIAGAFLPIKGGMIQGLTPNLDAFRSLGKDPGLVRSVMLTLVVGAVATMVAVGLSIALALYAVRRGGRHARIVAFIVFIPFVMPPMVTGLSLLIFFRDLGIDRSLVTVTAGHVVLILAVAYRLVVTRLVDLGPSLIEASLDLGASTWQTFRLVVLPNIAGSLAVAATLCFALSFDETLVTLLLTGTDSTFPIKLWGMTRLGISPAANAILAILLLVTILLASGGLFLARRSSTARAD